MTATPSRRTVLRTTAWSVPAISMAAAAPAFASSPEGSAAGSGTIADPFRRSGQSQVTPADGTPVLDTFTFASFPSGTRMRYAQTANRWGWHFIAISGISFELDVCAP